MACLDAPGLVFHILLCIFDLWILLLEGWKDLSLLVLRVLGPIVSGLPQPTHRLIFLKQYTCPLYKVL